MQTKPFTQQETELIEDVRCVLSHYCERYHDGKMSKTDLVGKLRGGWGHAACIARRWSFSAEYLNYDFDDVMRQAGITVERLPNGWVRFSL